MSVDEAIANRTNLVVAAVGGESLVKERTGTVRWFVGRHL